MGSGQRQHANWRALEMGRAMGVDIAAALYDRRLSRQDYGDMVETCARCTWAEGCAVWAGSLGDPVDTAPEICGNRAAFDRLFP